MLFNSFLWLLICNHASSYDEGRVVFKRKTHWLYSGSTDVGKETETIHKGNMWKWEDLQVVISSSNFHLETSSLFSPYIRMCHHGCIFGLQNTNKSHQQLHSTQMWSNPVCQNGRKATADDEDAKEPKMLSGIKTQGISIMLQASLFD